MGAVMVENTDIPPCEYPPDGWWCSRRRGHDGPCAARPTVEKVYEIVKFVNPRDAVDALNGMAVHAVAGPHDADAHGILVAHPERDGCMVSFHDVLTDEETCRTDIRNFVEVIVP
jgi:hypothetical protein